MASLVKSLWSEGVSRTEIRQLVLISILAGQLLTILAYLIGKL